MSRTEFLKALRRKLSEAMEPEEVEEQVRYYDDYIKSSVRKGQREEEVLAALGDPVLIARTILEAPGRGYGEGPSYAGEERPADNRREERIKVKRIGSLGCIVGAAVAFLIFFLLLRLVGFVVFLILRILAPLILLALLAALIRKRR